MPDLAPEKLPGVGGRRMLQPDMGRLPVEVHADPHQWRGLPVSVLTALLFSFSLLPVGAQEISLLLVSRVSLLCDPLLPGEVALESSLLPFFCLERPCFGGQRASSYGPFSVMPLGDAGGTGAHVAASEAASRTCSCTCFIRVPSGVRALLQAVPALGSSRPWRTMGKPWHTHRRDLVTVPSPSYHTSKPC